MIALDTNVLARSPSSAASSRGRLNLYEEGTADFSDYVIGLCGRHERATVTCTFDRRAAKSPLFRLVAA